MKWCQDHWSFLRDGIDKRRLTGFVAKSGDEACKQMVDDIKGQSDPMTPYDPLMSAHWMITNRVMEMAGPNALYLLTGDYCPVCELIKNSADCPPECPKTKTQHTIEMMDSALDHLRDEFVQNGWLKKEQIQ